MLAPHTSRISWLAQPIGYKAHPARMRRTADWKIVHYQPCLTDIEKDLQEINCNMMSVRPFEGPSEWGMQQVNIRIKATRSDTVDPMPTRTVVIFQDSAGMSLKEAYRPHWGTMWIRPVSSKLG